MLQAIAHECAKVFLLLCKWLASPRTDGRQIGENVLLAAVKSGVRHPSSFANICEEGVGSAVAEP